MRPFTTYQNDINTQIAAAMRELDLSAAVTRQAWGAELARLLTEMRRLEELRELPAVVREQARRIDELAALVSPELSPASPTSDRKGTEPDSG